MGFARLVRLGGLHALPLGSRRPTRGTHETLRPAGGRGGDLHSTVPVDGAQAVYMSGRAGELTGTELERSIEVFGRLSEADVGRRWGLEDVQPPSLFRLYRVAVSEHYGFE
jgi:hypothetical protein